MKRQPKGLSKEEEFLIKYADKVRIESLDTIRNYLKLMLPLNTAVIGGYLAFIQLVLEGQIYHLTTWYMLSPICLLLSTACAIWGLKPKFSSYPGGTIESYREFYTCSVEKRQKWVECCFLFFILGIATAVFILWLVPLEPSFK